MCINIAEILFGIANGQILSIFMPPTLKKLEEHIASGAFICSSFRPSHFLMHSIILETCMLLF